MSFLRTLTFLILATGLIFALSAWAQQKPLTQDQVQSLVRSGLGDESGAKLIEHRGIDFAPAEDFMQSLKTAGASEAFLKALRTAKPAEPASAKKPLHQVQILALLAGEVLSHRVAMLVEERGINFEPQDDYLQEVRLGGGDDELIGALKSAKVMKPVTVDPAAEARQAELRQHVARGAEFLQKGRFAEGEAEYRAAVRLDSQNADLHVGLSRALNRQRKTDEALAEAREALRLNPEGDLGHYSLGNALGEKGDWDGAITEEREALRLNPNNDGAHNNLGLVLGKKGDWDGAITEAREALRLNPNNDLAHGNLGLALGKKADWVGAITEFREAVRLQPNNDMAHLNLGVAFAQKHDWDGAIAEFREALRLNPSSDVVHFALGLVLEQKRDWDGVIAEFREALRQNPNNDAAHNNLGVVLEQKRDRRGALEEYRAAYMLDPKNATYKQNYERLLEPSSQLGETTSTDISGGQREATELANPSSLVTVRAGERLPDEELSKIAAHNRALCDQTITVAGLTPNGLALYVPPLGQKFMAKNSQNYPRMCLLEDAANVVPGVPRYLLAYAYSENAFAGFQPVTRVNTTTTPVSGSGTVKNAYSDAWNFTYYGTLETTEMDTIEAPYVIQSHSLYLNAYDENGHVVSRHSFTVSSQVGGNGASAVVYNGAQLIALLWNNPSHLIKSVLKDVQKDSKKYSKN